MLHCDVWQSLDKVSFLENAILLEMKSRSQGRPMKMCTGQVHRDLPSCNDIPNQTIRDFLDDFALVVSGNGGKDNVSAVSAEISGQEQTMVLRVARNEGINEQMLDDLRRTLRIMTKSIPTGVFKPAPVA
jgi:hypothetical protein